MKQAEMKRRQAQMLAAILLLLTAAVFARVAGENGVAYVAAAIEVLVLLWILLGGGTSDTLGKLLRIRTAKGQYKNVKKMRQSVFILQGILGIAGSLLLLIFADRLMGGLFRMQYSSFILMVLAPFFFLHSVSSVLLGLSQGDGSELPSAVAVILRQLFVLGFGLMFGRMLGNYGGKVSRLLLQNNFTSMYGGVGLAIAVSLTECFIVIFLFLICRGSRKPAAKLAEDGMKFTDSFFDSIRIFVAGKGLQPLMQLIAFLPLPMGLLFLGKAFDDLDSMAMEYGVYLSCYLVVCGIAAALIFMILLPLVGKIFVHQKKEEQRYARVIFQGGTHITVVHGAFLAVAMTALSTQIAAILSPDNAALAANMLVGGSLLVVFLSLSLYFGRILLLCGKKPLVLVPLVIADVVYVIAVTVFINAGNMGALALVYGGVVGTGVLCVLLGFLVYRQMRCHFDWLHVIVIPGGGACVSGLVIFLLARVLTPHVGNLIAIVVTSILGAALYWALLLLLRNFKEQEVESLPGSRIIYAAGQMLRVF